MHNADELHFVRIVYFVHFSQLSGRLCKNNDDRTKFCSAAGAILKVLKFYAK